MDIVERLREESNNLHEACWLASDEIAIARGTAQYWKDEHLAGNAEIERLREALRLIAQHPVEHSQQWEVGAKEMQNLARKALGEKE